jgi:hypothetical protein
MKQMWCAHGHGGDVYGLRTPPSVTPGITDSLMTDPAGID